MISHIEAIRLLDCYGELLSSRQREVCHLVFEEDLSLSEIQEVLSISRQAAHDALRKGVKVMEQTENQLHLCRILDGLHALAAAHPELKEEIEALTAG